MAFFFAIILIITISRGLDNKHNHIYTNTYDIPGENYTAGNQKVTLAVLKKFPSDFVFLLAFFHVADFSSSTVCLFLSTYVHVSRGWKRECCVLNFHPNDLR